MLTFQEERVESVWPELYALAADHHRTTLSYRRRDAFNPDRDRYIAFNNSGLFRLLTARDGAILAGYFGIYLTTSMHSQRPMATEDTFYLAPAYRAGRSAWRFLRYVESFLSSLCPHGIEVLFSCEQDNTSGIHGLLALLDYQPGLTVYTKLIPSRADSAQPSVAGGVHVGPPDAV